jgi:hypothetical protein
VYVVLTPAAALVRANDRDYTDPTLADGRSAPDAAACLGSGGEEAGRRASVTSAGRGAGPSPPTTGVAETGSAAARDIGSLLVMDDT